MSHRILLSGPGLIGKKHAEIVNASAAASLVGIVAPDTEENQAFASANNTRLYSDFGVALGKTNASAAIISSPNNFHYTQAEIALRAGIPALVEKPLTDDLSTAEMLVELVSETKVPLLVGHHRTHSPLVQTANEFMQTPQFGKLVAFQGSALFYKPKDYFESGPWRSQPGGGPLLINLIHEIGLWRIFCGEILEINAIISNNQRNFVVEDSASINIRFENDAIGSFILSDAASSARSWEFTSGENPMFPNYPEQSCYHFAGTRGSLDFPTMETKSYTDYQSWTLPFETDKLNIWRADPLVLQFEHFLRVVDGIETPLVSAFDGYKNLQVLDSIRQAAKSGRTVRLSKNYSPS
jgi:predicted dehydrogenase